MHPINLHSLSTEVKSVLLSFLSETDLLALRSVNRSEALAFNEKWPAMPVLLERKKLKMVALANSAIKHVSPLTHLDPDNLDHVRFARIVTSEKEAHPIASLFKEGGPYCLKKYLESEERQRERHKIMEYLLSSTVQQLFLEGDFKPEYISITHRNGYEADANKRVCELLEYASPERYKSAKQAGIDAGILFKRPRYIKESLALCQDAKVLETLKNLSWPISKIGYWLKESKIEVDDLTAMILSLSQPQVSALFASGELHIEDFDQMVICYKRNITYVRFLSDLAYVLPFFKKWGKSAKQLLDAALTSNNCGVAQFVFLLKNMTVDLNLPGCCGFFRLQANQCAYDSFVKTHGIDRLLSLAQYGKESACFLTCFFPCSYDNRYIYFLRCHLQKAGLSVEQVFDLLEAEFKKAKTDNENRAIKICLENCINIYSKSFPLDLKFLRPLKTEDKWIMILGLAEQEIMVKWLKENEAKTKIFIEKYQAFGIDVAISWLEVQTGLPDRHNTLPSSGSFVLAASALEKTETPALSAAGTGI